MIFISAAADTIPLQGYAAIPPGPRYEVVCTAVPWPSTPQLVTFQRDSGKPEPWDSWVMTANALNLCARTDGAGWKTCTVYADGKLVGTFITMTPTGEPRRGGSQVEEGKR